MTQVPPQRRTQLLGRRAERIVLALVAALVALLAVGVAAAAAAPATLVSSGPTDRPRVALSFDDGFNPPYAPRTVQVMIDAGLKATVFVTAQDVNAHPEVARMIAQGGFEIGDHTIHHPLLTSLAYGSILNEIGGGAAAFAQVTGRRTVPFFRPPYGKSDAQVLRAAGEKGYTHVFLWSVGVEDWTGISAAEIERVVLRDVRPGSIVLLHLSAPHTAEALATIISTLRARGYDLVTLSGLLKGSRRFFDVYEGTEQSRDIFRLVDRGIMSGYSDDWFGPRDSMTRAQFAKVAMLASGLHTDVVDNIDNPTFTDVPLVRDPTSGAPQPYPFDFVEEAAAAQLVLGYTDESGLKQFRPDGTITRGQLATIIARMARSFRGYPAVLPGRDPLLFPDVPEGFRQDVQLVAQLGLMKGMTNGWFDPWSQAQRAHVAVVISRFLDLPPYDGPPPPPSTTTTTLPATTTTTAADTSTTSTTTSTTMISPPTSMTTTTVPGAITTTGTTDFIPPVTTIP
jgi:peptidoglycan/xylan/chitin deacetylase (PgdA/CDA1 family)